MNNLINKGGCRTGKIARLPRNVREELNQRLLDGDSGPALIKWLNKLPKVKATMLRHFAGRAITEQNLAEWRKGGWRDWVAKTEAVEALDATLTESLELRTESGGGSRGKRRKGRKKESRSASECLSDQVAGWFFPHYVAAARGQLAAAQNAEERWSVLRTICSDLAGLRRSDHYVERLRIWQEKLRIETKIATAHEAEVTEDEFIKWARTQTDLEQKIWPDRHYKTAAEKEAAVRQILGITSEDLDEPFDHSSPAMVQKPMAVKETSSQTEK
jgi:hypothetical protein